MATALPPSDPGTSLLSVEHALRRCNEEKFQRRQKNLEYQIFIASLSNNKRPGSRRTSAPPVNWSSPSLSKPSSRRSSIYYTSDESSNYADSLKSSTGAVSKRSSMTSFDSVFSTFTYARNPTLKSPLEIAKTRRSTILEGLLQYRDEFLPARFFRTLPEAVYDTILMHVRSMHLPRDRPGCIECYLKDLRSLLRTSRAWRRTAEKHLYEVLYISKSFLQSEVKGMKLRSTNRLKKLRTKLRERPDLAKHVRVIRTDADISDFFDRASIVEQEQIREQLASIVMACPNLEGFEGFHPIYDHGHNRLTQALSSRTNLREQVWRLTTPSFTVTRQHFPHEDPVELFLNSHALLNNLKSLVIHGPAKEGCLNYRAFVGTFRKLGKLDRLVISNFAASDFNDRTVAALPAVTSIRLENLPGVTDRGLMRFCRSAAAKMVSSLVLVDLDVEHVATLRELLLLPRIRKFTLQQDEGPSFQNDQSIPSPVLASRSLQYLHWDTLVSGESHDLLAESIEMGAFPELKVIRSACDHSGLFQNLCRPMAQVVLDADMHLVNQSPLVDGQQPAKRSLRASRRIAQKRIDEARGRPSIRILIEDEGVVVEEVATTGFMGRIGSNVKYDLQPDIEGSDKPLLAVEDLFGGYGKRRPAAQVCLHQARYSAQVDVAALF